MLEYAFMFPLSIIVAMIAMAFGIGGAVLFSPIFVILFPLMGVTELRAADAFGAALITEVVGFASGYFGYSRKKLIDYKTAKYFLIFGIPAAVVGTLLKRSISGAILLQVFAIGMFLLAIYMLLNVTTHTDHDIKRSKRKINLTDSEGNTYNYIVCNTNSGGILTGIGGFITGLISVGIGETVMSTLRGKCNVPMKVAAGTSVFVVIVVVLTSAAVDIAIVGIEAIPWTLVMFTIPGVAIGGQLGTKLSSKIPSDKGEKILIGLFISLGVIMSYIAFF